MPAQGHLHILTEDIRLAALRALALRDEGETYAKFLRVVEGMSSRASFHVLPTWQRLTFLPVNCQHRALKNRSQASSAASGSAARFGSPWFAKMFANASKKSRSLGLAVQTLAGHSLLQNLAGAVFAEQL